MLRPKIVFDTQVISNANSGAISATDWDNVSKYISRKCRYQISVNTLYELLSSLANGDEGHFLTNQGRIRLLCAPAGREFLPLVGDFVRRKVFGFPARRPDFRSGWLQIWAEVVLAAKTKADLQNGKVVLRKAGHSGRSYGIDLQLLVRQIAEGKESHAQRLEKLRQGELLSSTSTTWSTAVLGLIGVPANDANRAKLLEALDAAHKYDESLYDMAKNHNYDFSQHDTDWIDSQQMYYLADPSVLFVTCDSNIAFRVRGSTQRSRILNFPELIVRATSVNG